MSAENPQPQGQEFNADAAMAAEQMGDVKLHEIDQIMPLDKAAALAQAAHEYNESSNDVSLAVNVMANEGEETHVTIPGRRGQRSHSTPVSVPEGSVHINAVLPQEVRDRARDIQVENEGVNQSTPTAA